MIPKVTKKSSVDLLFLGLLSGIFLVLRFPSLFEPVWNRTEAYYQAVGVLLRGGKLLYKDIFDSNPPLLSMIYALFNGDQQLLKLASLVSGIVSLWLFFFLAKHLVSSRTASIGASIIFSILLGLPLLGGNIVGGEAFIMPCTIGSALFLIVAINLHSKSKLKRLCFLTVSGILLGIGFLGSTSEILIFVAFSIFLVLISYTPSKTISKIYSLIIPLIIGFIIPFLLSVIFFALHHALAEYLSSIAIGINLYASKNIFIMAILFGKTIILIALCIVLFFRKKSFDKNTLFIGTWLLFSIYGCLLLQTPPSTILIDLLAVFSLFISYTFFTIKLRFESTFLAITLCLFLSVNFSFYTPVFLYYKNFVYFITNQKSIFAYQSFFDVSTPYAYQLAEFLQSKEESKKTFYVWGNTPQPYVLMKRLPFNKYLLPDQVLESEQTKTQTIRELESMRPDLIIVMPNQPTIPISMVNYQKKISLDRIQIYEKLF